MEERDKICNVFFNMYSKGFDRYPTVGELADTVIKNADIIIKALRYKATENQQKNEENVVYVSRYSGGYGDNVYSGILYVGVDYKEAVLKIKGFSFPDEYNNFGWISVWENGKHVKDIESI